MIPSDVKVMALRRDDVCGCGTVIPSGSKAGWSRSERRVFCSPCIEQDRSAVDPVSAIDSVDVGVPGAWLDREYQRRVAAREERVLTRHPRIGRILLRLAKEPHTTTAFAVGAEGERAVASELADALGESALFLFNRTLGTGGGKGDVDLVVVVPSGVWIVDPKHYVNRKVRADRRREVFIVDGRRRPKLAESMDRQVAALRAAVAAGPVPAEVHAAYCFLGADLPFRQLTVRGVPALSLRGARKELGKPGPLGESDRQAIHRHLAEWLPPA